MEKNYRVSVHRVVHDIERMSRPLGEWWQACLDILAEDPHPRLGHDVDHRPPLPSRTYNFEITQEKSVSGEDVHALIAEFLPEYIPAFVIDEANKEVLIFYLRNNDRV